MNPIKLYFAGAWVGDTVKKEEIECGVENKLCSYLYPKQFESWIDVSKGLPGSIIIDSGAFSAWNKGDKIDIDAYIKYCKEAIEEGINANKEVRVVNLDVIPGKKGESANLNTSMKKEDKELIDKAASDGYDNLCYFLDHDIVPIHVFHQGEDFEWLEKISKKTDYVGVSPANDLGMNQKRYWIDKVFSFLYKKEINVKTHGFAVFSPSIIQKYPWTSCDAATWRLLAGYGAICYPVGGYSNPDFSRNPLILHFTDKKVHRNFIPFKEELKAMLEKDGYDFEKVRTTWEGRCFINLRYFIELEKWVNKIKEKKEYKPTKGFML